MGVYGFQEGRRRILKTNRNLQPPPPPPPGQQPPPPPPGQQPPPPPPPPGTNQVTTLGNCVCRSCANFHCQASCTNDTSCAWNSSAGVCSDINSNPGRLLQAPPPPGPKVGTTTTPTSSPTASLCPVTVSIPNSPGSVTPQVLSCTNPQPWATQTCIDPSNDPYFCPSATSPISGATCTCMSTDSSQTSSYCMAYVSCGNLVEALTSQGGDFCSYNLVNGRPTINLNDPCYTNGGYCVFDCCSETFPICRYPCT